MAKVIITAQVEDAAKWEQGFRTHGELLKSMTSDASYFTITKDNELTLYAEPEDVDKYFEVLESPATAAAMQYDGVKRETVKVTVLDKEFRY
ncbi:MAG: hypothetical protein OER97_04490 [Gammaproteobacteria bacterium]|nr:hypothetical protein [Gammaproteobacteria bacterium]